MALAPRFTITNGIASALTRIERARGFLDAAKLSDAWIATTRSRAFLLEAHHTTHIEGTRLTLDQSDDLLAGRAVPEADPDDARELLNYREAFELVSEYLNEGGPLTEGLIREIHRRLVTGVRGGAAAPGEYRRQQNYVIDTITFQLIYRPPPAEEVPGLMKDLVQWLNAPGEIHPVLASGIGQFQFVHIHPFLDGNGRTSRLLSTLCLYRAGYDFKRLFTISEIYDRDRPAFYKAIQDVRDGGMDLTPWLEYFTAGLAVQLGEVQAQGDRALRTEAAVRRMGLADRQALAIGHVLEHGHLTIADFERLCPGANRRTLQRDLHELVEKKLLVAKGSTNRLQYVAGKGLT